MFRHISLTSLNHRNTSWEPHHPRLYCSAVTVLSMLCGVAEHSLYPISHSMCVDTVCVVVRVSLPEIFIVSATTVVMSHTYMHTVSALAFIMRTPIRAGHVGEGRGASESQCALYSIFCSQKPRGGREWRFPYVCSCWIQTDRIDCFKPGNYIKRVCSMYVTGGHSACVGVCQLTHEHIFVVVDRIHWALDYGFVREDRYQSRVKYKRTSDFYTFIPRWCVDLCWVRTPHHQIIGDIIFFS